VTHSASVAALRLTVSCYVPRRRVLEGSPS